MTVSVRSHLIAGVGVFAAAAIAIPPSAPTHAVPVNPPVALAASVRPLIVDPPSPQKFAAAVSAIERIDPSAREAALQAVGPAVAPAPLTAASNLIDSGYQFIQYLVDYGVQLTSYVLGFVPFGYLIAGQVNIVYFDLIRPIANSVVYGLIDPVVNEPLNLASYVNGVLNVGQATITALINTGISEFNYFFGGLVPPLPPLPLAVAKSVAVEKPLTARTASTAEPATEEIAPPTVPIVDEQPHAAKAAPTIETAPLVTATGVQHTEVEKTEVKHPDVEPEPETTTSANGVQAQGEVRGTTKVGVVTPTKDADASTPQPLSDPTPSASTTPERTPDPAETEGAAEASQP